MRYITYSLLLFVSVFFIQCQSGSSGLRIDGTISGIDDSSIFLERSPFNAAFESLDKSEMSPDGAFSMTLEEHPGPGVYRLRSGGGNSFIILDGSEKEISFTAKSTEFARNTYDVAGCKGCSEFNNAMKDQYANKMDMAAISTFLKGVTNPYAAQAYAGLYLKSRPDFVNFHEDIVKRLDTDFPDQNHDSYKAYINQMNQQAKARQSSEKIKVGQVAPEIAMPDANGKIRKLSDLRGKVVLVDFWASWCGPCRRANPEVVKIYDKYKDQGFDVFSVSLDGIDQQSKARFKLDDAAYEQRIKDSKKRWLGAIKKDNLKWDNHVSELTKWDCRSARDYGVRGIPKTFLVDREGKIAAVNPRFNLEEAIKATF